jgi:UDP-glucose 4-epimerase
VRVLVTGGSGYLGSRYLAAFAADPDVEEVVNVDVRPLGAAIPKTRTVLRSVTEDLADVMTGVDVVVHNVWVLDPLRDARRQRDICIGGTRSVLSACAAARVPHLVFISSDTAYGAHPGPQVTHDEREPLRAGFRYQYADEKREAEGLVARFAEDHPGVLVQVVRPATVWGPNVRNYIARMMSKPSGRCWSTASWRTPSRSTSTPSATRRARCSSARSWSTSRRRACTPATARA